MMLSNGRASESEVFRIHPSDKWAFYTDEGELTQFDNKKTAEAAWLILHQDSKVSPWDRGIHKRWTNKEINNAVELFSLNLI